MNKNLRLGLVGWAMSIVVALVAVPAAADPDDLDAILGAIDDPHPLRAADTSSPRDTLRSFIRDFSEGIQAWQKDEPEAAIYRPLYRASETFDATELAAIDRLASGALKMAFLREILDRIELPSFEQIPGDEEVAETGITRWTLPNTNIEIVKIEDGPNAGQFLFSNQTVEQLENYYEMAKALLYKKGAFFDLHEDILLSPGRWLPRTLPDRFPNWASQIAFGQALWQWFAAALSLMILGMAIWLLCRVGARPGTGRRSATRSTPIASGLDLTYGTHMLDPDH